jgi:DNA-binding NarL/FixJ family response regulator
MATCEKARPQVGKLKILIVDDHPIVRKGLARLIGQEPDIDISEGADNVKDALEQVKRLHPDLVIVDMALKDSQGLELISEIKEYDKQINILVWSMFDEKVYAERALHAGAAGYVNKQEPIEIVLRAIRKVLHDDVYLSPAMTNRVLHRLSTGRSVEADVAASLTDRELEVFQMVGQGKTTKYIACKLGVKPKTIESHREKVKTKLGLKNAAELNCRAVQWVLENG